MNVTSLSNQAVARLRLEDQWKLNLDRIERQNLSNEDSLDPAAILRGFKRDRRRSCVLVCVFACLGLAFALTSTRMFTATSQILIDERKIISPDEVSALNRSLVDIGMDPASIDSQIAVVESDKVALTVLHRLHLEDDASLAAPTNFPARVVLDLRNAFRQKLPEPRIEGVRADILKGFGKRTAVKRAKQTYVLTISFRDPSSARAAETANALTVTYVDWRLDEERRSKEKSDVWLKAKIAEAGASIAKMEGHLAESGGDPLQNRQLEREITDKRRLYEGYVMKADAAAEREIPPVHAVSVLADAIAPQSPDQPGIFLCTLIGALTGFFAALAASTWRTLRDGGLRSPSQMEDCLHIPTLGIIPRARGLVGGDRRVQKVVSSALLATRVSADLHPRLGDPSVIGVVSAMPREGRSTVAYALATVLAAGGGRVILIDAHSTEKRRTEVDGVIADNGCGFDRLRTVNAFEGLGQLKTVLELANPPYTDVVIDTPALSTLGRASLRAPLVNAFLLVVEWGRTESCVVAHALRANPEVAERTIGTVFNKVDVEELRRVPQDARDVFYLARSCR